MDAALTLATAATVGNGYMIGIASRLAHTNGWAEEQVAALRTGTPTNDAKIDELTGLVREPAANSGNVTDATRKAAQQAGWSDEHLTDAFAYLGGDGIHRILPRLCANGPRRLSAPAHVLFP